MENWKSPQERAEEEDAARSMPFCEQVDRWLHGDAPQECRECEDGKYAELSDGSDRRGCSTLAVDGGADSRESSGKAVHVDGVQVFPPKSIENMDDTREKLEADVRKVFGYRIEMPTVIGWLDRQAAITERETTASYCNDKGWWDAAEECSRAVALCHEKDERIEELESERDKWVSNAEVGFERIKELEAERDALQQKVDELELRERCAQDYDYRQAAEMWEQAFEDKCAELHLLAEERDDLLRITKELEERNGELLEGRAHWIDQAVSIYRRFYPHNEYAVPDDVSSMVLAKIAELEAERDEWKTKCDTYEVAYKQADAERKRYSEQIDELFAERDELKAELRECDEQRLEYRDQRDHLQANVDELSGRLEDHIANGDRLFNALIDTTADRDRLLEQLNRVWLKDADGNPLHIGESRYGEDGTGWRVTGFRWGSSHPVQGVDGEGRRRDLKPEWLRSERPDSLGSLLEDVRRGALAYPRDRITGYLEDNHSIGEAVLLDVRDRIEKLAGGSE